MKLQAVLIGALDTKGEEFAFVKSKLEGMGVESFVIDVGVLDDPSFTPDISSSQVAEAGGSDLAELRKANDRGTAVSIMTKGIAVILQQLLKKNIVGGVFSMGGTAGTTVGAAGMQVVPVGIPKMLVSTVASGNTEPYVGVKDIAMMYSVVDIAGLNQLSRRILGNAAYALGGMIQQRAEESSERHERKVLGVTMFGVTTPCVTRVREQLESQGYELLVFHATGTGGKAMEQLVESGFIDGVVDITTTELADELVGGIFTAGPSRLEGASTTIPRVISVGALDMVNFGPPETVPVTFKDRQFYQHNPTTTLMRTTVEENRQLGEILAEKINQSKAPVTLVFPHGGVSLLDQDGQAFEGKEQRKALWQALKDHLEEHVKVIELQEDINDPKAADTIAEAMLQNLK